MSRTGHHEDCGCSNLFWSFTNTLDNTNANKIKKRKANLEEDLLARGTDVWVGPVIMMTAADLQHA